MARMVVAECLTNLVWACSTANVAAPELYAAVAQEAELRGMRGFSSQGLVNTAWAFASAGEAAPALFAASGTRGCTGVQEAEFHRRAPPFALFRASEILIPSPEKK